MIKKLILLADDDPVCRKVLESLLIALDCEVVAVRNGDDALEALRRSSFDLVFLDIMMPGPNGFEVLRSIRASERDGNHVIVVAITGLVIPGDEEQYRATGFDLLLPKPVSLAALKEIVSQSIAASTAIG